MNKVYGVRLEPEVMLEIKRHYGGFSEWVRSKIKTDKKLRANNGNANKRKPTRIN